MAMNTTLSVWVDSSDSSVEAFKLSLQQFETAIWQYQKSRTNRNSYELLAILCSRCAIFGRRLTDLSQTTEYETRLRNGPFGLHRESPSNIKLGTLPEIFVQPYCALCALVIRQLLRARRRQIYENIRSFGAQDNSFPLEQLLQLAFTTDDLGFPDEVDEALSTTVELSLNAMSSKGTLSVWWLKHFPKRPMTSQLTFQ